MRRPASQVSILALLVAALQLAACTSDAVPSAPAGSFPAPARSVPPLATVTPAFGLTWAIVRGVERPEAAFAIPSNLPTGPGGPGTAGHPGHFPGQSIMHDVVADGDRLVAVGYTAVEGIWTADSWTSTDGVHWALSAIDSRPATFAERVAVDRAGTFVAVGRAGRDPAAWTSADGTDWTPATVGRLTAGGRVGEPERITTIIATDDGFLAGGSAGPELGERRARLWRSPDGTSWTPIVDDTAFEGLEIAALGNARAGLVALARVGDGQRGTGSVVLSSTSGTSWSRIDDPALADGLAVAFDRTLDDDGLIAVGSDLDEREAVAWAWERGGGWTRAPSEESRLHSGEKVRMTDVVTTDKGYVGIGNFVGVQFGTGTSWLSQDGVHWTQGPLQATLGQGEPQAITPWRGRLVIVGSVGAPDNYIPTAWISPTLP